MSILPIESLKLPLWTKNEKHRKTLKRRMMKKERQEWRMELLKAIENMEEK